MAMWNLSLKKNANIYVYDKGKYVTIAYKPLKDDDEVHFYTYKITDGKAHYLKTLIQNHIHMHMMRIIKKKI